METSSLIFLMLAVLAASFIQGSAGFGSALLLSPVLSLFINNNRDITSFLVMMGLTINIIMLIRIKFEADIRQVLIMTFFSVFGILAGNYALNFVNTYTIKIAVGIITAATGTVLLFNYTVKLKSQKTAGGVAGFLSGFLNSAAGLSGPPVAILLSNQNIGREAFLSTIVLYSFFNNIITLASFIFASSVTAPALRFTLINLPCVIAGTLLGIKISGKLKGPVFRKIIICMIIIIGIYLIIKTIF